MKRTLQHALEEAVPQPLQETAKRLGYSSPEPFRKRLPKLCAAILERRAECWRERKENLRIALETILLEDPPPTLEEVHKRVGYNGHTGLSRLYKDLCHSIARRHAEYRKAQFKNICLKLEGALREQPPVSLGAAAGRLGHAPFYLRKKFPEVCQAIIERYAQFKSKRSLEKKNAAKTKIRLIARELHARGQYPSKARVKKLSERVVRLGTKDFNAIMRDVRRELALLQNG